MLQTLFAFARVRIRFAARTVTKEGSRRLPSATLQNMRRPRLRSRRQAELAPGEEREHFAFLRGYGGAVRQRKLKACWAQATSSSRPPSGLSESTISTILNSPSVNAFSRCCRNGQLYVTRG